MEPTTRDRTTWKHWAVALALPFFITVAAPAIASLPLAAAYVIAGIVAVIIMAITMAITRAQR